jgi:hypothetical protein
VKNQKWILFFIALVLMAGAAGGLKWLKAHQKLGRPGINAAAIPGSVQMKIDLPERVLDFTSTNMPEPEVVLAYLPADTSYAERIYAAPDGFWVQATIVLMGADRTSIHNADFCLGGQGFTGREKFVENIPIAGPQPYQLPVARWDVSGDFAQPDGSKVKRHGVYVFWFVADGEETPDNHQRMWWLGRDLLRTGVLQRWAYLSYFTLCAPGQEDATFARMEKLIAASVPEFQSPPGFAGATATAIAPR